MSRVVVMLVVVLVLGSCVSYDRCVRKYGRMQADSILVPFDVVIPGDSVLTVLQIDSIPFFVPGDTVYVESPESRARIRYWRDKYDNSIGIQADCDSVVVRDTIRVPYPVILDPPPPGRLGRMAGRYTRAAAWLLPVLVLFIVSLIKLKK